MPQWLEPSLDGGDVSFGILVARLLTSLFLGCIVAAIYFLTQRKSGPKLVPFLTTLLLLTILIAMVTLVIGNSVARAFSLVGALAIVRFRTVVEDTRDTAFVIFAVVVGMAAGAGYLLVPLAGIPMVAVAALVMGQLGNTGAATAGEFSLSVRLGIGYNPDEVLRDAFAAHTSVARLQATSTARQGAAIEYLYHLNLRREEDAVAMINVLNQLEGVQNVELRRL